jgi:hypothetical protein
MSDAADVWFSPVHGSLQCNDVSGAMSDPALPRPGLPCRAVL